MSALCRVPWLLLLLAGCGASPVDPLPFQPASETAAPTPSQPGPFAVGVRTVTYEDTGRRKADGTPRRLVTEIWYPAVQGARQLPKVTYDIRDYFTDEQRASLGDALPALEISAARDAEPALTHGPFPLVIFSHGQAALRWQSTYYTVLLASHGYVVASCDHEEGTLADVVRGQLQTTVEGVEDRPWDVIHLINRFERMKPEDPLAGMVDMARVGVTGHSFGALTSLRVAAMDARVKAIVPQAPVDANLSWIGLPSPVRLSIPVMVQAAHADQTLEWDDNVVPTLAALQKPWWLLDIVAGGHFTFSDLCAFDLAAAVETVKVDIPGADLKAVLEDGCGPTSPPASVAQPLINHFAVAFFNAHLRGSGKSLALLTQAHADELAGGAGVAVVGASP
jgi:predicted dienelactone hydrolase